MYATADIVISPSYHEGLCVPVLEGYAFGCRVIGTTAGNLPYIVQPPDPCVEPGDAEALSAAIVRVVGELKKEIPVSRRHSDLVEKYSVASSRRHLQIELYRLASGLRGDSLDGNR